MHEELWQPLVAPVLCRSLDLRPECLYSEVPTRDGSRADLVYAVQDRLIVFELKMGQHEAVTKLDNRALRQLRHYRSAANAVYLVSVVCPREWSIAYDGAVIRCDPLEAQALPAGVGWIGFDRLSLEAAVLHPAPELEPDREHKQFMVNHLLGRLQRASKQLKYLGAAG